MYEATFLNQHGDITITWTEDNADEVKDMIQKKMDEGYQFFMVERALGIFPKKTPVSTAAQLKDKGKVVMKDEDVQKLFFNGTVALGSSAGTRKTTGLASSASQAARTSTVATRPAVGG